MRQLPKAIPELDGGLFLPRPVVELLEAMLVQHEQALRQRPAGEPAGGEDPDLLALRQLRLLLRLGGPRPAVPPPREQLGLGEPRDRWIGRNLLRG